MMAMERARLNRIQKAKRMKNSRKMPGKRRTKKKKQCDFNKRLPPLIFMIIEVFWCYIFVCYLCHCRQNNRIIMSFRFNAQKTCTTMNWTQTPAATWQSNDTARHGTTNGMNINQRGKCSFIENDGLPLQWHWFYLRFQVSTLFPQNWCWYMKQFQWFSTNSMCFFFPLDSSHIIL